MLVVAQFESIRIRACLQARCQGTQHTSALAAVNARGQTPAAEAVLPFTLLAASLKRCPDTNLPLKLHDHPMLTLVTHI
jgi:hypothetical protein